MNPGVTFSLDTSLAEAAFRSLAGVMEQGYPRTTKKAAEVYSRSIDLNFINRGRPRWNPLSPVTIKIRHWRAAHGGPKPVAGWDTPLRVRDTLRKAATATKLGVFGSGFKSDKRSTAVGVNGQVIKHALRLQEGDPGRNLPAREFIVERDEDDRQIKDEGQNELNQLARRFNTGGL